MAVKFQKKEKVVPVTKVNKVNEVAQKVDAYVSNFAHIAGIKQEIKEFDALAKELKGMGPEKESFTLQGTNQSILIGEPSKKREVVSMKRLHQMVGDTVFYQIVKASLEDIDNYLNDEQKKEIIKETKGGARKISIIP